MFYTTVEQSKKLLEAGVKPETADMVYVSYADVEDNTRKFRKWAMELTPMMGGINKETELPAWSSDALIKLLPKHVEKYGVRYDLEIKYMEDFPYVMYVDGHKTLRFNNTDCNYHVSPDCNDYSDGVYQMIFWLINDGYLTFEKDENNAK